MNLFELSEQNKENSHYLEMDIETKRFGGNFKFFVKFI